MELMIKLNKNLMQEIALRSQMNNSLLEQAAIADAARAQAEKRVAAANEERLVFAVGGAIVTAIIIGLVK